MHRTSLLAVLCLVILGSVLILGPAAATSAQDATPVATAGHPLVGAWLLDTDTEDPADAPTLASFTSDGIYFEVEEDGTVGVGTWQATGPTTANMTFHGLITEDETYSGIFTVRAQIEAGADGQSLTASYTLELTTPDGTATGQYGPGNVTGTKIAAEPMGTPQGSIEDLFAQFEQGTPEATPAP